MSFQGSSYQRGAFQMGPQYPFRRTRLGEMLRASTGLPQDCCCPESSSSAIPLDCVCSNTEAAIIPTYELSIDTENFPTGGCCDLGEFSDHLAMKITSISWNDPMEIDRLEGGECRWMGTVATMTVEEYDNEFECHPATLQDTHTDVPLIAVLNCCELEWNLVLYYNVGETQDARIVAFAGLRDVAEDLDPTTFTNSGNIAAECAGVADLAELDKCTSQVWDGAEITVSPP